MSAHAWLAVLIEGTVAISAAALLVLGLRKPLRRAFGARVAYGAWSMVPLACLAIMLPAAEVPAGPVSLSIVRVSEVALAATQERGGMDFARLLLGAWALGAAAFLAYYVRQQHRFVQGLGRLTRRDDGLYVAQSVIGLPAAIGVLRPRIVLPADHATRYSDIEQNLMIDHERGHIARGDLLWNALAALLRCLLWFNPLLHLAAGRFRQDQELACDQYVLVRQPASRRAYGEAMLKNQLAAQSVPLACHWASSHPLRERIAMLKQPLPSFRRRLAGSLVTGALVLAGGYTAWAAQPAQMASVVAPAGMIDMRLSMRVNDGAPTDQHFVVRPGTRVTMSQGDGAHHWDVVASAELVTGANQERRLSLAATIRKDGVVQATPRIEMASGRPGTIQFGEDRSAVGGGFEGLELVATLTEGQRAGAAPQAAVVASSSGAEHLPPPAYPRSAADQGIGGRVVLLVDIDARGIPTNIAVQSSQPAGVFDAVTIEAARTWRFNPAMEKGKPVASRVRVPVDFTPDKQPGGGSV